MTFLLRYLPDLHKILLLAGPLTLTNIAQVALTTIDIMMMGMLGPKEIAAGGLGLALFNQLRTMGTGLVTGTGNLVAYAHGMEDSEGVRQFARTSLLFATLVALAFGILLCFMEQPLIWLGQDPEVARMAGRFLRMAAPGMLPCLWFQALRQYTVGLGIPGPLLAITVVSTGLNGFLDYALMFGHYGLPRLGLPGVGLATSSVFLLSFLLFLIVIWRRPALANSFSLAFWKADRKALKQTWRMGLPIAATFGSEAAFFTVLTLVIGTLGTAQLAAQTIVNQIVYIVLMVSAGISHAASIRISAACARKDFDGARRLGHAGLGLGLCAMAGIGLVYLAMPRIVLAPFLNGDNAVNVEVVRIALQLLMLAVFLQVFDCGQNVGIGLLRGLGEVKPAFRMTLYGYWLVGLPMALWMGLWMKAGILGIWAGLTLGLATTAILLIVAFERNLALRARLTLPRSDREF